QGMALDPLGALEQPAEAADLRAGVDPQRLLQRVAGAHLVGDRADAADPGGDIGHLADLAAAEEGLEEAGGLVDVQLDPIDLTVFELDVQRPLALDSRQGLDLELAIGWHRRRPPSPHLGSALETGRSTGGASGQIPPQPACVTGPRQGIPCATAMHTARRRLHSTQTL